MEDIDMNNNYEKEIARREELLQKARDNIKLTKDERTWLVTHPVYNWRLGFPYFNVTVEKLEANKWYTLRVNVESVAYDNRIIPIISAPAGQGQIIADFELTDLRGNVTLGKPVKMLGFELAKHREFQVDYRSKLGLLSVAYECDYFDVKQNLHIRQSSSTGDPDYAINKQIVNDHMIRYYCKSPLDDSFDAMVFTIEWTKGRGH